MGAETAQTVQMVNLIITLVMTCFVFKSCRFAGTAGKCVAGVGFFTVAFYLDLVSMLIMEGLDTNGTGKAVLGILAVAISKSILVSGLIFGKVILAGQRQEEEETGAAGSVAGSLKTGGSGAGDLSAGDGKRRMAGWSKPEFDYMTGLTLGVTLFFLVLYFFLYGQQGRFGQWGTLGSRFITAVFLLFALLLFYASQIFYERKRRGERRQAEALDRKREADVYLENVENNYQRTRELWHDLKNHINLLNTLLSEQKYGQMADYLKAFGEDVDSLTLPVKSGNIIVDALLEDKIARARKENVEVNLSLCNLTGLHLKPDEICGLFGNLLDNALEANRQVQEGKSLEIDCREQEETYYIKVKNAAAGKAKEQGGILQTAKTDRLNRVGHGLGLRSVERIVHGCGGELAVDSREREFTVVVRLPRM